MKAIIENGMPNEGIQNKSQVVMWRSLFQANALQHVLIVLAKL